MTVFLTNLSQLPFFVQNGNIKILSYIPWILSIFYTLYMQKGTVYFGGKIYMFFLPSIVLAVCIIHEIKGNNGLGVFLLMPIFMCVFIYLISVNVGNHLLKEELNHLLFAYVISGVILTFSVFQQIVAKGFSWNNVVYAYASKNSVSQIILTAIICALFLRGKSKKAVSLFFDVVSVFMVVTLFMLKSRATLLGLVIVIISVFFLKEYGKGTKWLMFLVVLCFSLALMVDIDFRESFVENIIYANRDKNSLDALSSGRVAQISEFPSLFWEKPFLGHGQDYIECMMLDAFLETGIFGGLAINIMALVPMIYSIRQYRKKNQFIDAVLVISAICYYGNGLFEQQAPFGPGVKCYFLWMLFGISVAWKKREGKGDKRNGGRTVSYNYSTDIHG